MWTFKCKLSSSTFMFYCLLLLILHFEILRFLLNFDLAAVCLFFSLGPAFSVGLEWGCLQEACLFLYPNSMTSEFGKKKYIYIYKWKNQRGCIDSLLLLFFSLYPHIYIYILYPHIYLFICICIYMYMYIYTYTYTYK